jgi:FkbM family methyltransferase
VTIEDVNGFKIECEDDLERWRAETFTTKEPGTLVWLEQAQLGDVVYDVGANIGLYTLVAARRVGPTGHVYAFEPHAANVVSLLRNVTINEYRDRVTVIGSALGAAPGFAPFHYAQFRAGSSGSQLGRAVNENGGPFEPLTSELKHVTTIDALLQAHVLRRPTLIKIDVDGNEPAVLAGMRTLLGSVQPPQSVQVETRASTLLEIAALLTAAGYQRVLRHDTASGAKRIAAGADPESLAYNLVFGRAA